VAAVPVTNTIVEAREASVPSGVKSAAMKSAKSGMKPAAVEPAAMESTTAVKTPAPAMGASIRQGPTG
jgi:hypothetical protein